MASDRDIIAQKMMDLKDALNVPNKFNGAVITNPTLPLKGGNTRSVTFTATATGTSVAVCTVYVTDNETDGFKKGDVVKPNDNTVGFNLIQEKNIPMKINLSCFDMHKGLIHTSNFRAGFNAAKAEAKLAMDKVQGDTDALKDEIEKLKNSLSQIHMLSEPSQDP